MSCARQNLSSEAQSEDYELDHPFASGQFRWVARGTYTNGPRCNQPCVLKWFKTGAVYESTYFDVDIQAVAKAQEIVDAYHAEGLIDKNIHLNHPAVWQFQPGTRRAGQKILVEPFIKDYVKFNSNSGWACNTDGWCEVMQALSHYSYHKSGGHVVLCDLQGGLTAKGAVLTDPVIMSRSRSYGVTDLGPNGISTFFARHRCSRFCNSHWSKPRYTAVHYAASSGTTMELHRGSGAGYSSNCDAGRQQHQGVGYAPAIHEEADDDYDEDDEDDYYDDSD